MPCEPGAPYSRWIATHGDPRSSRTVEPRAALVTSELYDGSTVTLPVMAIAVTDALVLVRQRVDVERHWLAWVPRDRVRVR
jgi:hypothetical protein